MIKFRFPLLLGQIEIWHLLRSHCKKKTIKDGGMWMWLKGYHLPYLSLHIQQRRCSSMAMVFPPATKLVRNLTVSERRKGTWVVYVEPRDARLEWANGVSRWFRLFRWIEMMGSDKQYVWGCQDILSSIKDWHVGFPALPNVVHFRKFPEHPCFFYWFPRVVSASSGSNKLISPILDRNKVFKALKCRNALPIRHRHTMVTPRLLLKG